MYNLAAVGYVLVLTLLQGSQANTVGINVTVSGVQQRSSDILASLANLESSAVRTAQSPGPGSYVSPGLLSAFPEDIEISDQCQELLQIFSQQCSSFVDCILTSARPVRVCQNCFSRFNRVQEIFTNISSETSFGNVSCRDSLLRSDRLQLVFVMYQNLKRIWESSLCEHCLTPHMGGLSNDSLYFMALLNKSLSCFEKYQQQSNRSELCKECKTPYKSLNNLYNSMVKNSTLCIDIEDAMNMTRRLWSKNFNCSFPREETVPIIAVSSFMLFLPIIFYLSSFLHSEQKKRKLILPKRAKSSNSLMNIQDKCS